MRSDPDSDSQTPRTEDPRVPGSIPGPGTPSLEHQRPRRLRSLRGFAVFHGGGVALMGDWRESIRSTGSGRFHRRCYSARANGGLEHDARPEASQSAARCSANRT